MQVKYVMRLQGYLVANHLPTEDMIDIALYASRYNILTMSRISPLGGSMIWQEVITVTTHFYSTNRSLAAHIVFYMT